MFCIVVLRYSLISSLFSHNNAFLLRLLHSLSIYACFRLRAHLRPTANGAVVSLAELQHAVASGPHDAPTRLLLESALHVRYERDGRPLALFYADISQAKQELATQ